MNKVSRPVFEISFKVFVVVVLTIVLILQFRASDKIAYVDSIKLINGYKGMVQARKAYEAKTGVWRSNLDSLKSEFEARVKEYEANHGKLSNKEKEVTEELLRTKQEQFINYQRVIEEKIQAEDQQLTTAVLGKVNDYIKKYGEEQGYEIIMAATQYGNIVYADKGKDITEEVLEGLNGEASR